MYATLAVGAIREARMFRLFKSSSSSSQDMYLSKGSVTVSAITGDPFSQVWDP